MEPVPADAPVTVRFLEPDEADALTRSIERCYGDSYDAAWVYEPPEIARRIRAGVLRSCVGVAPDGDIVGHFGLVFDAPGARVGEGGQAVVDPRYRGHHLFTTMKRFIAAWARGAGIYGIFSEATAAHPYSQKANLDIGARETGLLLGYIPETVEDHEIAPSEVGRGRRQSVVLFYLKTNDGPPREIHPPERHREMIARLVAAGGLRVTIAAPGGVAPPAGSATRLAVQVGRDHGIAVITVLGYGRDFIEVLGACVEDLAGDGLACLYVDLPLAEPATRSLGGRLDELGFHFGGIFPNRAAGRAAGLTFGGDVLRLQRLNGADVRAGDVAVASPLGRELLAYVTPATLGSG